MYVGDVRLGDTVDQQFSTSVGQIPTTLGGAPALSAYVDNGTVEITAGLTLTVDFDGKTGCHHVRVVASAGNGFAAGTEVGIWLATGSVGGVTIAPRPLFSFSIEKRSGLMATTPGRKVVVDASGLVDATTVKIGPSGAGAAQTAVDVGAIKVKTDLLPASPAATADITAALQAVIPDSIPVDGQRPSVQQALYLITQYLYERGAAGSTLTVYKPDGVTPLATLTMDDAVNVTRVSRAT